MIVGRIATATEGYTLLSERAHTVIHSHEPQKQKRTLTRRHAHNVIHTQQGQRTCRKTTIEQKYQTVFDTVASLATTIKLPVVHFDASCHARSSHDAVERVCEPGSACAAPRVDASISINGCCSSPYTFDRRKMESSPGGDVRAANRFAVRCRIMILKFLARNTSTQRVLATISLNIISYRNKTRLLPRLKHDVAAVTADVVCGSIGTSGGFFHNEVC